MNFIQPEFLSPEIPPSAQVAEYTNYSFSQTHQNIFVDALIPSLNAQELRDGLRVGNINLPDTSSDDSIRKLAIRALVHDYFVPVPEVMDLYEKMDCAIKDGYKHRMNGKDQYQTQLMNLSQALNKKGNKIEVQSTYSARSNSFLLHGNTGNGKTMVLDRCLRFYPQVIWHPKVAQCQIVYLRIDLAGIETPLEYCALFLESLEKALGSMKYNHEVEVSKNVSAVLLKIQSLVQTYNVGITVVDSIESLADWSDANRTRLLKHFRSLGQLIPILYSGTTDVLNSVALEVPWLHSALSFGSVHWDPLGNLHIDENERVNRWRLFTNLLWKRQCLREAPNELTSELSNEWFDACQGVIKLAINFFSLCQLEAIASGEEKITLTLMKRVRYKESKPLEFALKAYESNDISMLSIMKGVTALKRSKKKSMSSIMPSTIDKPKHARRKKKEDSEFKMPAGFKKVPKKDWSKLPENDLRYIFSKSNGANFYQDLKSKGLVLTMEDLMGNGQFSSSIHG